DSLEYLIVGSDFPLSMIVREMAFWNVRICAGQRRSNLLQADSVFVKDCRVQFHTHGRQRTSPHNDLTDTLHLRQPPRHDRGRGIVYLSFVQYIRCEGEHQDRRIGGIYFFICRIVRKVTRQVPACSRYCRLDIASGGIDIAIEIELQRDTRCSERTRRRHLCYSRDASELALERRGN